MWRWDDGGPEGEAGYVRYEGESGPTLRFAAGAPMTEQLHYALLLSNRTGRILAEATALISIE